MCGIPEATKPAGPSNELVHAPVKISKGSRTPVKSVDEVHIPQGHQKHQISRARGIIEKGSAQQIEDEGSDHLINLSRSDDVRCCYTRVIGTDRVKLHCVGPLHGRNHVEQSLNIVDVCRGHRL